MTLYLDTSLLVAGATMEARGDDVRAWLAERGSDPLATSLWVEAEFSSALSVKLRSGKINAAQRAAARTFYRRLVIDSFVLLPISDEHFHRAARLADQTTFGLRAGDALHLAIAADHGAALCTLDRRLAEAGPPLAIETVLV